MLCFSNIISKEYKRRLPLHLSYSLLKMHLIVLLLGLVQTIVTIRIGRIQNATWIFNSSNLSNRYTNISNTTCEQCLCRMLAMDVLTTSIACQPDWKTCQLLLLDGMSQLQADNTSIVYIQTIPLSPQVTASILSTGERNRENAI